jgi:hypothetical protein
MYPREVMALRFKLDENLPRRVESALRDLGHDVETAISEGLAGATDPTLLTACTAEDRLLARTSALKLVRAKGAGQKTRVQTTSSRSPRS